jgi:hypothetical protein
MLSSVLRSKRAVHMHIIVRAFVKLRELLATTKTWPARLRTYSANRSSTESRSPRSSKPPTSFCSQNQSRRNVASDSIQMTGPSDQIRQGPL